VGESRDHPFQLSFNSSLRVDFWGPWVISDRGLLFVREFDERLGLTGLFQNLLVNSALGGILSSTWRICLGRSPSAN
jgi:hypothetical protein